MVFRAVKMLLGIACRPRGRALSIDKCGLCPVLLIDRDVRMSNGREELKNKPRLS